MDTDRRRLVQAVIGLVMIPVSLLPFVWYFRDTAEGRLLWTRATVGYNPPELPEVRAAAAGDFTPYDGGVAVLVYHGLGTAGGEGRFTVTVEDFAEQLATLRAAGVSFVTARDLVAARGGERALPPNAVMITFDDGRADAMLLADPLLDAAGARATMFVIGDVLDDPGIYYASEGNLRSYARSRRWDLESHTAGLHDVQDTSLGELPMLTSLRPDESLDEYRRRVVRDLERADRRIEELSGRRPVAFAYPFGAYGGDRTNDARIRPLLRLILAARYAVAFQQDDQHRIPLAQCADPSFELGRVEVGPWSGPQLLARIGAMRAHTWDALRCGP